VDISFFQNDDDFASLGKMFRTARTILTQLAVAQLPCDEDPEASCPTCPNILADSQGTLDLVQRFLRFWDPYDFRNDPPSAFNINHVEAVLDATNDDTQAGRELRDWVNAGQHYCGTAAMGKVVDNKFKVKGLEGAYVADASVLPFTSRGNVMATVMMLGRLAGESAAEDMR